MKGKKQALARILRLSGGLTLHRTLLGRLHRRRLLVFNYHRILPDDPSFSPAFEANVYRLPDLLGEANQQNYLTQFTPALLLYECLKAMEPFIRNDARLAVWKGLADDEINNVNTQDLMKVSDRAQIRMTS